MKRSITMIRKLGFMAIFVIGLIYAASAPAAGGVQSLASIRLQAEAFILQHPYQSPYPVRFTLGNLDSRLRLKTCPKELAIDFSRPGQTMGNTALRIHCPVKPGWKIHFPVRIEVFDEVAVAGVALRKGQKIDAGAVRFEKRDVARLKNGYYAKPGAMTDLQARRNLPAGTTLTPSNLVPRLLVRSGQQVTLVLNYKGIRIRTTGKALRSAAKGEVVRVRNSQSMKIVEGVVTGEALVQVSI